MKKILILALMLSGLIVFIIPNVLAHCPLCTTGAAVGVGFVRAYGVDDSIVGLFIGALISSSALWFDRWLKKKINFPFQQFLIVLFSFLILVVPFYYAGLIINFEMVKSMPEVHGMTGLGILGLAQFGIDKLLFGIILGTLVIWGVFAFSDYIKKERSKVLFPYQSISFMFIALILLSLILWLITK